MPKANGKDAFYFSHDCNARNDNKILAMRSVYGAEGYGLYWMLIEILREQPDYRYPLSKFAFKSLAMDLHCDTEVLEAFVLDCCEEFADDNSTLLKMDENYMWSDSLLRRMTLIDEVSVARREAAQKRWNKEKTSRANQNKSTAVDYNKIDLNQSESESEIDFNRSDKPANHCASTADANALQLQSKIKEKKEKEKKEKETREEEKQNGASACSLASEEIFSLVLDAYRKQTGREPSASQENQLAIYCEAMGTAVVLEGFKIATEREVKNWSYTKRILQDWSDAGVHSIEEVQRWQGSGKPGGAGRNSFASGEVDPVSARASFDRLDMLLQSMEEEE